MHMNNYNPRENPDKTRSKVLKVPYSLGSSLWTNKNTYTSKPVTINCSLLSITLIYRGARQMDAQASCMHDTEDNKQTLNQQST